ncbi:MAG: hypothetical protein HGB19_08860 [Chlorobiales bacterium]|jgi:required for meiotic nuclear division protein 1|nr:hypothetical protein [Chlorobiales bacterium]
MKDDRLFSSDKKKLDARAWFIGTRIETRELERAQAVALSPLTVRAGEQGYAILFRFGVVVFIELNALEQANFIKGLESFIQGRFVDPEIDALEIIIDPESQERTDAAGRLSLHEAGIERLQVVSHVLAKSAVVSHYETRIAGVFDRIERLAESLRGSVVPASSKELLREIGDVLLSQARMVGRVEVTEKPEITWDNPELDRLYERLAVEYELRERDLALSRKLDLISRTAETYLDLLQNRQSIRVEWYIVILIIIEIVLVVYQMFVQH